MTESFSASASPALSPAFDRAKRISGFLSVVLSIAFWLTLVFFALLICAFAAIPFIQADAEGLNGVINLGGATIHLDKLSGVQPLYVAIAVAAVTVPSLFVLHHARLVFRHFKNGAVFEVTPIEHIRQTGLWLMISLGAALAGEIFLDLAVRSQPTPVDFDTNLLTLLFGLAVYVAAYVMQEARRIADDHATII